MLEYLFGIESEGCGRCQNRQYAANCPINTDGKGDAVDGGTVTIVGYSRSVKGLGRVAAPRGASRNKSRSKHPQQKDCHE